MIPQLSQPGIIDVLFKEKEGKYITHIQRKKFLRSGRPSHDVWLKLLRRLSRPHGGRKGVFIPWSNNHALDR